MDTYSHRTHFQLHLQSLIIKESEALFNNIVTFKWGNIRIHPVRVIRYSSRPWTVLQPTVHIQPNIAWLCIAESKTQSLYTWKIIKKLNSLVAAMGSITLISPTLAAWRRLKIRSLKIKQLINIKDLLPATHFYPLLPPIKNILPNAKLKDHIMHDYCRQG